MQKITINLKGNGGDYGCLITKDEKDILFIKKLIKNKKLCLENEDDENILNFFDGKEFFGVHLLNSKIRVLDNDFNEIIKEQSLMRMFDINFFNIKYQCKNQNKNVLKFGGYIEQEDLELETIIKIPKKEKFSLNDIYIGTVNLKEFFGINNEVINDRIFYIPAYKKQKIMNLYKKDNSTIIDVIEDFVNNYEYGKSKEPFTKIADILEECECYLETLGGYSTINHVIVRDANDTIIYKNICE